MTNENELQEEKEGDRGKENEIGEERGKRERINEGKKEKERQVIREGKIEFKEGNKISRQIKGKKQNEQG